MFGSLFTRLQYWGVKLKKIIVEYYDSNLYYRDADNTNYLSYRVIENVNSLYYRSI